MKRYLVFGFSTYYPGGGADDYRSVHIDEDSAKKAARALLLPHGRGGHDQRDEVNILCVEADSDPPVAYELDWRK